jgi:hypothetical protein
LTPALDQASLWDAAVFVLCPGNELPGYYHSVPTGTKSDTHLGYSLKPFHG